MRSLRAVLFFVACTSAGALACTATTNDGDDNQPTGPSSAEIGPAGGTVTSSDGTEVVIPEGALGHAVTITMTPASLDAPSGSVLAGTPYTFGPEGLTFYRPVVVRMVVDTSVASRGSVVIMSAPHGTAEYESLPTTHSAATSFASCTTMHFSDFVPVVPEVYDGDAGYEDAGAEDTGEPIYDASVRDGSVTDAPKYDGPSPDVISVDAGAGGG